MSTRAGILTVVVDTREQTPWAFAPDVSIVRRSLPAGDYSIAGLEDQIAIERKSLSDFVGTLTWGRERFDREMAVLAEMRFSAIVVEADVSAILRGEYRTRANPKSLLGSCASFLVDYEVPVIFAGSRPGGAYVAEQILRRLARKKSGEASDGPRDHREENT